MIWLVTAAALAGSVYINDVEVNGIKDQTFEGVTVSFDATGDIHIDAPGYHIEVEDQPTAAPEPGPPPGTPAPRGRWWLVTEDNDSLGHVVEVFLNGRLARRIPSGEEQMIIDVGEFLLMGDNAVKIVSNSTSASGGTFYVYLGGGSNDAGTIMLEQPDVQFGLGASRSGEYVREYTLKVR